MSHSC